MLRIGVLGAGNLGNQVAALAKKTKNFPAVAINSSERDIDSIKSDLDCIIFGDKNGSGKDRSIAKQFAMNHMRDLLSEQSLISMLNEVDYCFVITSTGGGTGSGVGPMITDMLQNFYNAQVEEGELPKVFINVGVLPSTHEAKGAQRNTAEYIDEMEKREDATYMLFDNGRVAGAPNVVFDTVNKAIVEALAIIRGDYSLDTPYGMIDEKDMRKLITQPGMLFVDWIRNFYVEKIPVGGSLEDLLLDHVYRNSCMVSLDRNKVVKRTGFIANMTEDVHSYFDDNLPKIRAALGEPLEDFRHFAVNMDDSDTNFLALIMSGLTLPSARIKAIKERAKDDLPEISKEKEHAELKSTLDIVAKYSGTMAKKPEKKTFDMDAVLSKY
jgi:hypothetical protein